ncbi:MAG: tetratricopeptide repeat protein [Ignavibacteriales bacterium]|nr:tetratricopeptide repeat protein [Ignavibacteriales bacterium]
MKNAILLTLFISLGSIGILAQDRSDSPVYKNYRNPSPSAQLKRSDIDYNLMHIFMLERKAYSGDVAAQQELGLRYLLGEGVVADTLKGAFWIKRAAEQNSADAAYNLGILEFNGMGLPWNPFDAYKLFKTAATQGMVEAEYILSMFMTENLVVPRNWEEAYKWLKKSADAGYAPAKEAVADFDARGLGKKDEDQSAKKDTSSSKKKPPVKQTLGFVFLDAEADTATQSDATLLKDALREATPQLKRALGISKEPTKALDLDTAGMRAIRESAEEGSPEALTILGRSYERGIGVTKDPVTAAMYYIRAIRMSSPRAPGLLARLIEQKGFFELIKSRVGQHDGDAEFTWAAMNALKLDYLMSQKEGFITDKQALEFLTRASSVNHIQAMIELGLCYYSGRWVPEDRRQAMVLWAKASALGSREARLRIAALSVRTEKNMKTLSATIAELEQAAQRGAVLAQVALGYCYETGTGVAKRLPEAVKWYRSSAQRGSQDAYYALKRLHDQIRPKDKEFQIGELE